MSQKIKSDTNGEEIVKGIVNAMYKSGSDNRSNKGGNPSALIEEVLSSNIQCIGLWTHLPPNFKAIIDNKQLLGKIDDDDKKLIIIYLIKYANTYSKTHYFYIKGEYLENLEQYVKEGSCRNEKFVTNLRKYFLDAERKKCGGGGTKANSNYDFLPYEHEKHTNTLKILISS